MRSEQVIFDELTKLCTSPGYVHALAYLCFRDTMVIYSGVMRPEDMAHLFSPERLIRTEISTLVGQVIKADIDISVPPAATTQRYIDETEQLLKEFHEAMLAPFFSSLNASQLTDKDFNPFTSGAALREPIFYGGDSAYIFQYRDLSPKKYGRDDEWLKANKGFSIHDAKAVVFSIERLQNQKLTGVAQSLRRSPPEKWTLLPGYTFAASEIAEFGQLDLSTVENVLAAFSIGRGERNARFNALHDFNVANASPLIPVEDGTFLLFQQFTLAEALYESPFYWLAGDRRYEAASLTHRGMFTEEFATERLVKVFGDANVYPNVNIFDSRGQNYGEIDVLVLFGNRAVILQAKSKRLTIEARKGNDGQIRTDFKKSIQDSYDQAYKCAIVLTDPSYTLKDARSQPVAVQRNIKEIYLLCLVSDHYPALSFQARQFLRVIDKGPVSPPFVLDVFTLDSMSEMLESPLHFLSYVDRRAKYADKVMAGHETVILSYHLKRNLFLKPTADLFMITDDIAADLDNAMTVRREGIPGERTPDGILTRFGATTLGRIFKQIEAQPDAATIDLGFLLLNLSEDAVLGVSNDIEELARRARSDGQRHDLTIGISDGESGLTIHCGYDPIEVAQSGLDSHCRVRKYAQHAVSWFGLYLRPEDAGFRFGIKLDFPWQQSPEMDAQTRHLPQAGPFHSMPAVTLAAE